MFVIYKVFCLPTKKLYVGQTINFDRRKKAHINCAKNSHRKDSAFHNALRKYGESNFLWETLEHCKDQEESNNREVFWIAALKTKSPNGYNIRNGGQSESNIENLNFSEKVKKGRQLFFKLGGRSSNFGIRQSKEHVEKRVSKLRGKKRSVTSMKNAWAGFREYCTAHGGPNLGRKFSTGQVKINKDGLKKYYLTHRGHMFDKKQSETAKNKMSESKRSFSDSDIQKMLSDYKLGLRGKPLFDKYEIKSSTFQGIKTGRFQYVKRYLASRH